jgi:hypothetical protein
VSTEAALEQNRLLPSMRTLRPWRNERGDTCQRAGAHKYILKLRRAEAMANFLLKRIRVSCCCSLFLPSSFLWHSPAHSLSSLSVGLFVCIVWCTHCFHSCPFFPPVACLLVCLPASLPYFNVYSRLLSHLAGVLWFVLKRVEEARR